MNKSENEINSVVNFMPTFPILTLENKKKLTFYKNEELFLYCDQQAINNKFYNKLTLFDSLGYKANIKNITKLGINWKKHWISVFLFHPVYKMKPEYDKVIKLDLQTFKSEIIDYIRPNRGTLISKRELKMLVMKETDFARIIDAFSD